MESVDIKVPPVCCLISGPVTVQPQLLAETAVDSGAAVVLMKKTFWFPLWGAKCNKSFFEPPAPK